MNSTTEKVTNFKPILYQTEMVKAILDDRKSQTRRLIKEEMTSAVLDYAMESNTSLEKFIEINCKIKKGDVLWVRETTKVGAWNDQDHKIAFDYAASPELKKTPWIEYQDIDRFEDIHLETIEALDGLGIEPFRTDEENERFYYKWEPGESPLKWKPSIHMPKEAARIFLKVTNVRAERLQDISEEDAIAEGIASFHHGYGGSPRGIWYRDYKHGTHNCPPRDSFRTLWDSINAKKHPWYSNPWVWVYDFERIEKPADFI